MLRSGLQRIRKVSSSVIEKHDYFQENGHRDLATDKTPTAPVTPPMLPPTPNLPFPQPRPRKRGKAMLILILCLLILLIAGSLVAYYYAGIRLRTLLSTNNTHISTPQAPNDLITPVDATNQKSLNAQDHLTRWSDRQEAFVDIVKGICDIIAQEVEQL